MARIKCSVCRWEGKAEDILVAVNPFDPEEEIEGCPKCKSIDSFYNPDEEPTFADLSNTISFKDEWNDESP